VCARAAAPDLCGSHTHTELHNCVAPQIARGINPRVCAFTSSKDLGYMNIIALKIERGLTPLTPSHDFAHFGATSKPETSWSSSAVVSPLSDMIAWPSEGASKSPGLDLARVTRYICLVVRLVHVTAGVRRSSAARASLRPRAENGQYITIPLYQRFVGWRRAAGHKSRRSAVAVIAQRLLHSDL
jgi:hypothetical protein